MLKTKTQKIIVIIILLLICSVLIRIYKTPPSTTTPITKNTENVSPILLKYESPTNTEINIYDFMSKLKTEGKITFQEKTYAGMGKFIGEINGIKNGEKNWIYYVNGEKANIGISNYKINNGDIVSWKYETY